MKDSAMPRARNIKPGFFVNPDLVELPPLTRILFIGLWCIADRAGRLADRPRHIKMTVLPGDSCDVDVMLWQLVEKGFIRRYSVDGVDYIQVENFAKHQSPHIKEPASTIPQPIEDKAVPCKPGASTMQAHLIADSGLLIPDTGLLNDELEAKPPEPMELPEWGYHGEIVRMKWKDWKKWIDNFPTLNVLEHVKSCEKTYLREKAEGKNPEKDWFWRTAQALAKAHQQKLAQQDEAAKVGAAIWM